MKDWLSIGQFAKRIGASPKALRMYEEMGLLAPHTRGENGYRVYHGSQIPRGERLRELKALGFSLKEIEILLKADTFESAQLIAMFEQRLQDIDAEIAGRSVQKAKIKSLLTSLRKQRPLTAAERKSIMRQFETMCVVVTGTDGLLRTAELIGEHLERAGRKPVIVEWPKKPSGSPSIYVIRESDLVDAGVKALRPDVVVVRNVGATTKELQEKYLNLFAGVGPQMSTIFNADDRASLELAAHPTIRSGKIYYFSKNSGLEDQIQQIGGVLSDGEEIRMYGFNSRTLQKPSAKMSVPLGKILNFGEEVALISSLAALLDVGMEKLTLPAL